MQMYSIETHFLSGDAQLRFSQKSDVTCHNASFSEVHRTERGERDDGADTSNPHPDRAAIAGAFLPELIRDGSKTDNADGGITIEKVSGS